MAYQMVATAVTLNDHEGHSPLAGVVKCNPSNICAAFYMISTDSVIAWFLCISRAYCQQLSQKTAITFQLKLHVARFLCSGRASCYYQSSYTYCLLLLLLLHPGRGVGYCHQFVCLSVCLSVHEHISESAKPIVTNFFCADPLWPWLSTPLAALQQVSGFMDDVTFGRSGPYGDVWKAEP